MVTRSALIASFAAAGIVAALGVSLAAQSGDPSGTYSLNVAASKFSPGPAPKSSTVTYSAAGAGLKVVVESVAADGGKTRWEFTANYDGKDYPVTGNPDADAVTLKRINATTVETAQKKGGKPTMVNTRVLSADGKTVTITVKGTNAKGQAVTNVQVFERK